MSDLSFIEKSKLEKLLNMSSGYVLDFSNRTFEQFVADSVQRDIYDEKYSYESGSKANRLRAFWNIEPNHLVGKLLADLLEYSMERLGHDDQRLKADCLRITERLRQGAPVFDFDALEAPFGEHGIEKLARSVRRAIDDNEPEAGLDRLHTFVLKCMRSLCEKHGVSVSREKPLHSLIGEYVKHMKAAGRIEAQMTERILKSSISTMEAFNRVRNEQSMAHDNPILNYDESLLIFNHVTSSIRFIAAIEREYDRIDAQQSCVDDDDIPF